MLAIERKITIEIELNKKVLENSIPRGKPKEKVDEEEEDEEEDNEGNTASDSALLLSCPSKAHTRTFFEKEGCILLPLEGSPLLQNGGGSSSSRRSPSPSSTGTGASEYDLFNPT